MFVVVKKSSTGFILYSLGDLNRIDKKPVWILSTFQAELEQFWLELDENLLQTPIKQFLGSFCTSLSTKAP